MRAVRQKIEGARAIVGDAVHDLSSTIVTMLCAAALVALAVIITMLPFVLL
jgi:hypothetical protein